ncbi:MAG: class I SAM-dependent methyltransferase [Acidimicrobiales bacterium]
MVRTTAHIYDLIHNACGKDYATEAAALDETIRMRHPQAASLLDVACGTGRHLAHLRHRYDLVGLDVDPEMLEQARKRLPGVSLIEADMRSFQLDRRFDAISCLFSSIGYMRSVEDLHAAAGCMARHLGPGGVLVVDGWLRPDAWIEPGTVTAVAARSDGVAVARVGRSRRVGTKTHLDFQYLVGAEESIAHLEDQLELTLFTDEEYQDAIVDAGLRVEMVPSPMAGRDRYIGVMPT